MTMQPCFAFGQKTGISQIHKISDAVPGAFFCSTIKNTAVHHKPGFAQASEAATFQVISLQYFQISSPNGYCLWFES